jgi:hypothetical protein
MEHPPQQPDSGANLKPPVSLRLTQAWLWLVLIGGTLGLLSVLLPLVSLLFFRGSSFLWQPFAVVVGMVLVLLLVAIALYGISQRRPYGRWLSVAILVISVVAAIDNLSGSGAWPILFQALSEGRLPPVEGQLIDDFPDNSVPIYRGYRSLALYALFDALSIFLSGVLPVFLITRLIFSAAVKRVFRSS